MLVSRGLHWHYTPGTFTWSPERSMAFVVTCWQEQCPEGIKVSVFNPYLCAALERADLVADRRAAIGADAGEVKGAREHADVLADLDHQLPRRCHDEPDRAVARCQGPLQGRNCSISKCAVCPMQRVVPSKVLCAGKQLQIQRSSRERGLLEEKLTWSLMWRSMGSTKASVLPEPVLAMPMQSRPLMMAGRACA